MSDRGAYEPRRSWCATSLCKRKALLGMARCRKHLALRREAQKRERARVRGHAQECGLCGDDSHNSRTCLTLPIPEVDNSRDNKVARCRRCNVSEFIDRMHEHECPEALKATDFMRSGMEAGCDGARPHRGRGGAP